MHLYTTHMHSTVLAVARCLSRDSIASNLAGFLSSLGEPHIIRRLGHLQSKKCITAITYKAKHSGLPVYLHDLLDDYQPTRTLRSSTANKLQRPPLISSFADRSFSICNDIDIDITYMQLYSPYINNSKNI